jgi:hypothetical protein
MQDITAWLDQHISRTIPESPPQEAFEPNSRLSSV